MRVSQAKKQCQKPSAPGSAKRWAGATSIYKKKRAANLSWFFQGRPKLMPQNEASCRRLSPSATLKITPSRVLSLRRNTRRVARTFLSAFEGTELKNPGFSATKTFMENFRQLMEIIGTAVDGVGVFIVAAGALVATARLLVRRTQNTGNYYSSYRQDIGRAILLGLEFLIAGDIIRTVVVAPTIQNVLVLGLIVLIRTFLSLSLQLEIEGRLPWQRANNG